MNKIIEKYKDVIYYSDSSDKREINRNICKACNNGHEDVLEEIIKKYNKMNYKNIFNFSCLNGYENIVNLILKKHKKNLQNPDIPGIIDLEEGFKNACIKGNANIIKSLLKYFDQYEDGFFYACEYGHEEVVKIILKDNNRTISSLKKRGIIDEHLSNIIFNEYTFDSFPYKIVKILLKEESIDFKEFFKDIDINYFNSLINYLRNCSDIFIIKKLLLYDITLLNTDIIESVFNEKMYSNEKIDFLKFLLKTNNNDELQIKLNNKLIELCSYENNLERILCKDIIESIREYIN